MNRDRDPHPDDEQSRFARAVRRLVVRATGDDIHACARQIDRLDARMEDGDKHATAALAVLNGLYRIAELPGGALRWTIIN